MTSIPGRDGVRARLDGSEGWTGYAIVKRIVVLMLI
jgi:hypothetical protein